MMERCKVTGCVRVVAFDRIKWCAQHYVDLCRRPGLTTLEGNTTKPNRIWDLQNEFERIEREEMEEVGKEEYIEYAFERMKAMVSQLTGKP